MRTPRIILGIVATGLLMAASSALADTFNFTDDHCSGGCGTSPFGSVTLTQNGANVDVVVSLNFGNKFIETGAGNNFNFFFNDSAITIANITNITSDTGQPMAAGVTGHADGTGTWQWGVDCTTCSNGAGTAFTGPIRFTVTNTTLAQMEVGNGTDIFGADIISGQNGNTGDVGALTQTSVPDGGTTLMLLGSALSGLGLVRRFFWR